MLFLVYSVHTHLTEGRTRVTDLRPLLLAVRGLAFGILKGKEEKNKRPRAELEYFHGGQLSKTPPLAALK